MGTVPDKGTQREIIRGMAKATENSHSCVEGESAFKSII